MEAFLNYLMNWIQEKIIQLSDMSRILVLLQHNFAKRYAEFGDYWVETFKLPSFEFEMGETVKWVRFEPRMTDEFYIVYLIDATGSIISSIRAAKETIISIANDLKAKFSKINF